MSNPITNLDRLHNRYNMRRHFQKRLVLENPIMSRIIFLAPVVLSLVSTFAQAQTASPQTLATAQPPAKSPPAAVAAPSTFAAVPIPAPVTSLGLPLQPAVAGLYSVPAAAVAVQPAAQYVAVQPATYAAVPAMRQIVIGPGPVCHTLAWAGRQLAGLGTWQWVIQRTPVAPPVAPVAMAPPIATVVMMATPVTVPQPVQYEFRPVAPASPASVAVPIPTPVPALEAAPPPPVVPTPSPQRAGHSLPAFFRMGTASR